MLNVNESKLSNIERLKQQLDKLEAFRIENNHMIADLNTDEDNYDDIEDFITIDFESMIIDAVKELEMFIDDLE